MCAKRRREPTAQACVMRACSGRDNGRGVVMARYGKKAQAKVERAMHERKEGTLRSGGSGKKVTSPKQAIAIGLSEARRAGGKVPARASGGRRRTSAKKSSAKKK